MMLFLLDVLGILPNFLTFSVPLVGLSCGIDGAVSLSLTWLTYLITTYIVYSSLGSVSFFLCWIIQTALAVLLLASPLNIIPKWLIASYHVVVRSSTLVWMGVEAVTLVHISSLISSGVVSYCDEENFGHTVQGLVIAVSFICYTSSAIQLYFISQHDMLWLALILCLFGVVSFCYMYAKEEGNLLDTALLMVSSSTILYLSLHELRLHDETANEILSWNISSDRCAGERVVSLIWTCIVNIPVTVRMWLSILHPISLIYLILRALFAIFYFQLSKNESEETEPVILEVHGVWETLSSSKLFYQILTITMLLHLVCQHLMAADESSTWWRLPFNVNIIFMRFLQAVLVQMLYVFSLYNTDDAD